VAPLVVVACALLFALACAVVGALVSRRRARRRAEPRPRLALVHSINDDRCTGCEACVGACPTDVLALVGNKSRVARFEDCIACEQCAWACPTTALVMHPEGTEPPPLRMPVLDAYYQAAPGLYLIGEASGKPLVKNASNLGRAVVEHVVRGGLSPSGDEELLDVFIVGSGPAGLSAALSCAAHGLSYAVVEKDELIASTIARYPKGKHVMAEPADVRCLGLLPVWDARKEELLADWSVLLALHGVRVATREPVEEVSRDRLGIFRVRTARRSYRARRVVLAVGTRGKPRRLGVPGEELQHVSPLLHDPEEHRGRRVLVVGGGDSAVEAALALAGIAARVTLSYRGRALSRCKAANRVRLDAAVAAGTVHARFGTRVTEIRPASAVLDGAREVAAEQVLVCIGGEPPVKWLASVGVRFEEQPHLFQRGPTDRLVESLLAPPRAVVPGIARPRSSTQEVRA
jgi:thioredoxin reductase/formate hydrogenlyase subunit 6/NADH:ubiquinone oxidoreductase subunit I